MDWIIFDMKGIFVQKSGIEQFGYDWLKYNLKHGLSTTYRAFLTGLASILSKRASNDFAYLFADVAFKGAPKELVEKCCQNYRKFVPKVSKKVVNELEKMGLKIGGITHDVRSLSWGMYDVLGLNKEYILDNDFSWYEGRVSGIVLNKNGRPRVNNKAYALQEFLKKEQIHPRNCILVAHGVEEAPMASIVSNIVVPKKNSCRTLRKLSTYRYDSLEELPDIIQQLL